MTKKTLETDRTGLDDLVVSTGNTGELGMPVVSQDPAVTIDPRS